MKLFAHIIFKTAMSNFLWSIQPLKQLPGFSLKFVGVFSLLRKKLCIGRIQCINLSLTRHWFTEKRNFGTVLTYYSRIRTDLYTIQKSILTDIRNDIWGCRWIILYRFHMKNGEPRFYYLAHKKRIR